MWPGALTVQGAGTAAGADREEGEKQAWAGRTAGQCQEEERLGAGVWEPSEGHQGLGAFGWLVIRG